ncbi:MFS transporter [Paractinoplanes rhizophilus]|uniref:MFS transporter n=1 Tax=Paractinoplanes rhizophilus TaxID=1416877 RepID=A0ABW2HWN2_9ACTN
MTLLDRVHGGPIVGWPRRPGPVAIAAALAGVLGLVWALWLARDAGDLAAQYAWTAFVRRHPGAAYNLSWYGGIHPASYSVLSPYLMAWLGVRTTGVLACTGAAALGAALLTRSGIRRPLPAALWLAVAVWGNLAAGRVTYLLGMMVAMAAAILALHRPRPVAAAVLGAVATLCSPVAGLFVEVLAAALVLTGRRRPAYLIAAGPPVVIGVTALLFPFSGVQPFHWYAALPTAAAAVAVAVLAPPAWRTVRAGAWVYALGVALCWALPTPIGSNVERLALLAGAAILICVAAAPGRRGWRVPATYVAAAAMVVWTVVQPATDVVRTAPAPAATADAQPLISQLHALNAQRGRVEVVPLRSHWEAAGIAPYVNLARGWNRQADVERNPLFYDGTLTAATYRQWLRTWSVGYIVLPASEPDSAGVAEARIVTAGPSWLSLVWADAGWRVYRVRDADPLASAPATVTYAGPATLTVRLPRAGSAILRIAWSPWLAIAGIDDAATPHACLAPNGAWTELVAPAAGTFTIEARYSLDRGTPCPAGPAAAVIPKAY